MSLHRVYTTALSGLTTQPGNYRVVIGPVENPWEKVILNGKTKIDWFVEKPAVFTGKNAFYRFRDSSFAM